MSDKKGGLIMSGTKELFKKLYREKVASGVGTSIKVKFSDGKKMSLVIAEKGEGEPSEGTISCDSPLAKAVLNAKVGEEVFLDVGDNKMKVILIEKTNSS